MGTICPSTWILPDSTALTYGINSISNPQSRKVKKSKFYNLMGGLVVDPTQVISNHILDDSVGLNSLWMSLS